MSTERPAVEIMLAIRDLIQAREAVHWEKWHESEFVDLVAALQDQRRDPFAKRKLLAEEAIKAERKLVDVLERHLPQ